MTGDWAHKGKNEIKACSDQPMQAGSNVELCRTGLAPSCETKANGQLHISSPVQRAEDCNADRYHPEHKFDDR